MRCLVLACAFREQGAKVAFICREHPGNLINQIRAKGFEVLVLPTTGARREDGKSSDGLPKHWDWLGVSQSADAGQTLEAIAGVSPDVLVVDHYALDSEWETALSGAVGRIIVLDDLADRAHSCAVLVDANYSLDLEQRRATYRRLVAPETELLLGPRFVLLRPEFLRLRQIGRTSGSGRGGTKRVLVFFGASDPSGSILQCAQGLLGISGIEVRYVISSQDPKHHRLLNLLTGHSSHHVSDPSNEFSEWMMDSDFFIGAGGTTTWERACLGVPSLVVSVADNQIAASEAMARDGRAIYLGRSEDLTPESVSDAVRGLLRMPSLLQALAQRNMELVDGKGVARVVRRCIPEIVSVRPALSSDEDLVYSWRNSEEVRVQSFDQMPIPIDAHRGWFRSSLAQVESRRLLICESGDEPIGVLRYDLDGEVATASVYLAPQAMGRGAGALVLEEGSRWVRANCPQVRLLRAEIRTENERSIAVFEAAGYKRSRITCTKTL